MFCISKEIALDMCRAGYDIFYMHNSYLSNPTYIGLNTEEIMNTNKELYVSSLNFYFYMKLNVCEHTMFYTLYSTQKSYNKFIETYNEGIPMIVSMENHHKYVVCKNQYSDRNNNLQYLLKNVKGYSIIKLLV